MAGIGPRGLHDTRSAAIRSFAELGFPAARNEDWKFTNLASLTNVPFERIASDGDLIHADEQVARELIENLPFADNRLVFVNGSYFPTRSSRPDGQAVLGSLHEAFE